MGPARAGLAPLVIGALVLGLGLVCFMPGALAWPGPPTAPPPKVGSPGPPPAWIESQTRSAWMAYGSYCWRGKGTASCADMIAPEARHDVPIFTMTHGGRVRVHLGFSPSSVQVSVDKQPVTALLVRSPSIVSWRVRRGGMLIVGVTTKTGDASYLARLKLR